MTTNPNQSTLVSKLTLVVLVLILGCLGALVYRVYQEPPSVVQGPGPPPAPEPVQEVPAAVPVQTNQPLRQPVPPVRPTPPAMLVRPAPAPPPPAEAPSPDPSPPPLAAVSDLPPPVAVPVPVPPAIPPEASGGASLLRYVALPNGSEMRIEGDSSAHKWACVSKIIGGSFEVEPAWQTDPTLKSLSSLGKGKTPPRCTLKIPVTSLKSQVAVGPSIMDSRLQNELNAKRYRTIDYELTELEAIWDNASSDLPIALKATGNLVVRGVTNRVSFPVTWERPSPERLTFNGTLQTKMSALGVKPPEFTVLGVGMKTGDEIVLKWKWALGLTSETAAR